MCFCDYHVTPYGAPTGYANYIRETIIYYIQTYAMVYQVSFYSISTLVGQLMPNPIYIYRICYTYTGPAHWPSG